MAVYTKLSEAEIRDFLAGYALGELMRAEGITKGVENSNYLLEVQKDDETKNYILTLFEKRVQLQDIPFFSGLMEHVALQGFPCPLPLHGKDGEHVRTLAGKSAMIVTFLQGAEASAITPQHTRQLGEAAARLHQATGNYLPARANDLSLTGWHRIYDKIASRLDEIASGLTAEVKAELAYLDAHWPQELPRGVIHADLFPDNVFFDNDNVSGVIDFYFSCNDFLAYELAVAANAWCFDETGQWQPARTEALFAGYNSVRRLNASELEVFPVLARGAALRFLLTRAHDWLFQQQGAQVKVKDPLEYANKLRFFKGKASALSA